ncbi:hypothetical protein SAMN05421788_103325 [Filimonas lacunae]|uniref:YcxB-like protein n=1 Tax=Filimonas lacunae TaxID=477680 RepID=A0A173MKQ2_9BACT|nr:hypothetical protein [Filimonas lacunae]BAV07981.1 hypothetical protein FLA_4014 [Filimonas lacunae]SIT07432.1 hypothetical protein SAMN05421788_103325 [Filimonas lacunae]
MQQFKTLPGSFEEYKKVSLKKIIPVCIIAVLIALLTIYCTKPAGAEWDVWMVLLMLGVIALFLVRGIKRGLHKSKILLESYTLTITDNSLVRQQAGTPEITLYYKDVKSIVKSSSDSITVYAHSQSSHIFIPSQIENKEALEALLQAIQPFSNKKPWMQQFRWLIMLVMLGSFVAIDFLENKTAVAISGVVFTAIMVWSIYEMHTNKNVPDQRKKRMLWYYIIAVCGILTAVAKVTGITDNPAPVQEDVIAKMAAGDTTPLLDTHVNHSLKEPVADDCVFDTSIYKFTVKSLRAWKPDVVFSWDKEEKFAIVALANGDSLRLHIGGCYFYWYAATIVTNITDTVDTAALHEKAVWAAKTFLTPLDKRWPALIAASKVEKDVEGKADYVIRYKNPDRLTNISFEPVYIVKENGKWRIQVSGGMD